MGVFCTYCGSPFTREEHLERHILTHTNVKPFKCFTCHMSFARRDLLQRHYTVHGRDQNQEIIPASDGMIPRTAGRTPIACSNCAKTKTKCDKKFPCSRCSSRGLCCTLRPTRRSTKNASRIGLITAETIANGNVQIPTDQTVAAISIEAAPPVTATLSSPAVQPGQGPQLAQAFLEASSPLQSMTDQPLQSMLVTSLERSGVPTPPFSAQDKAAQNFNSQPFSIPSTTMLSPPESHNVSPSNEMTSQDYPAVLPSFDDFSSTGLPHGQQQRDQQQLQNPQFMLDWSQIPLPTTGFDQMASPDMTIGPGLCVDVNGMPLDPSGVAAMGAMSAMTESTASTITPMDTPQHRGSNSFSDIDIASMHASHQRHMSVASMHGQISTSQSDLADLSAVIVAQDGWNVFRCTPTIPSGACPVTAKLNLEQLERTLQCHDGWNTWTPGYDDSSASPGDALVVMQLHESTRDKLLAITQSFLHKALETHRAGMHQSTRSTNFVLLPPTRVLEYFLRSYANNFEPYYPLTDRGTLDVNELLHCYNDQAASLLVLMMIAQGAANMPSSEARWLTGGLTEACRISLFDLIERNIILSADPIVLHAALLFTEQAAWSGDKWQMDIAMGQRGMYSSMLRHSGALDDTCFDRTQPIGGAPKSDHTWIDWMRQESRSRLIYTWAMVDQDLALFHDTAPLFSVTEFGAPMPDAECLWKAKSSAEWSPTFEQVHEFTGGFSSIGSGARPPSLRDLFRCFLDDEMSCMGMTTTPLQMRLLLHPLQSMVCHYSQLISCFSDAMSSTRTKSLGVTAASTRCRVEEIQCLLQRWYSLSEQYLQKHELCAVMQANLILYHLIYLNTVTSFPEVERLARREGFDGTYQSLVWQHKRCITDFVEASFHCGQVLRLVRDMPRTVRPPWWAGAVYRVALVLWCDSLINKESNNLPTASPYSGSSTSESPVTTSQKITFSIDGLKADHPLLKRYLTKREGSPHLSKRDGTVVPMDHCVAVLGHCIEILDEGASTRFSSGIRSKLGYLMQS